MSELHTFVHEDFGPIRAVEINGEPWLVGKDVAGALGYKDTVNALKAHVDDDDKRGWRITTRSGEQTMTVINESGFYSLVLSGKLPTAKKFKRWVTSEVLPSIRKTGNYDMADVTAAKPQRTATIDDYLRAASIVAGCRNERLPYVLGFLEQGGLHIPKIQEINTEALTDGRHSRYAKTGADVNAQTAACAVLRDAVNNYGFSQAQLSRLTGLPESVICKYRRGSHRPTPERALYILDVMSRYLPQQTPEQQ